MRNSSRFAAAASFQTDSAIRLIAGRDVERESLWPCCSAMAAKLRVETANAARHVNTVVVAERA
jgi:hypothetical protein